MVKRMKMNKVFVVFILMYKIEKRIKLRRERDDDWVLNDVMISIDFYFDLKRKRYYENENDIWIK